MPRIALTNEQKSKAKAKDLTRRCRHLMDDEHIKQSQIIELTGKSQQEVSYELLHRVSIETLIAIAELTGREVLNE